MSLPALLQDLKKSSITVEVRPDGNLKITPKRALTPELRERLKAEKSALIAYLQVEAIRRADEVDRLAAADADLITPAMSLIGTCRRLRIALRLDPDGRLVLGRSDLHGKEPEIPPSLAWQLKFMPARLPNCSEPMNRPFEVKNKMAP